MKHFATLFIITLFLGASASAQVSDSVDVKKFDQAHLPKAGTIVTQKDLRKFAGTWSFSDEKMQVTLKLEAVIPKNNNNIYQYEMLIGGYKITRSGIIIGDTMKEKLIYAEVNRGSMNKMILYFINPETYKRTPVEATLIDKNTLLVSLSSLRAEGLEKDARFDLLNNLTLKRL
jgi:hypothetical protein